MRWGSNSEQTSTVFQVASPACAHMNSFWERTYLMMRGYCSHRICVPGQSKNQFRMWPDSKF